MITKTTLGAALVAASALFSFPAAADTLTAIVAKEMMDAKMMDKNHDGMVSKAEFLAMMGKMYDMKAKDMGAKNGTMTVAQFEEFRRALSAAGGGQ